MAVHTVCLLASEWPVVICFLSTLQFPLLHTPCHAFCAVAVCWGFLHAHADSPLPAS